MEIKGNELILNLFEELNKIVKTNYIKFEDMGLVEDSILISSDLIFGYYNDYTIKEVFSILNKYNFFDLSNTKLWIDEDGLNIMIKNKKDGK